MTTTTTGQFQRYLRKQVSELRPYVPGEDLAGISVHPDQTPEEGDWVARQTHDHKDQWLVKRSYFEKHFEPLSE